MLLVLAFAGGCRASRPPKEERVVAAPTKAAGLHIVVDESFPEARTVDAAPIRHNFQAVAEDVLFVLRQRCAGRTPPGVHTIVCYASTEPVPKTYEAGSGVVRVGIALSRERLEALDYSQFAYQLGHELGHVLMGPRITNGLVETLCHAFAVQVIEDLAVMWPRKYAHHPPWRDYGQQFRQYGAAEQWRDLAPLPAAIQKTVRRRDWSRVRAYLKRRQTVLDRQPYDRTGYALRRSGVLLLRSGDVPWPDFVGITAGVAPAGVIGTVEHPLRISNLPPAVRLALRRLGRE